MSTIQPSQETAFINAMTRSYTDPDGTIHPAILSKADWITLQAMGLQIFSAGTDYSKIYPGQIRDSFIMAWLSIQSTAEKKRAFRDPDGALDKAQAWIDTADQGQCGQLMTELVGDKVEAQQAGQIDDTNEGEQDEGETLPH